MFYGRFVDIFIILSRLVWLTRTLFVLHVPCILLWLTALCNSEVLRFGSEGERAYRVHWQPGHGPVHEWDPHHRTWILPVLLHHWTHRYQLVLLSASHVLIIRFPPIGPSLQRQSCDRGVADWNDVLSPYYRVWLHFCFGPRCKSCSGDRVWHWSSLGLLWGWWQLFHSAPPQF